MRYGVYLHCVCGSESFITRWSGVANQVSWVLLIILFTYLPFINFLWKLQISSTPVFFLHFFCCFFCSSVSVGWSWGKGKKNAFPVVNSRWHTKISGMWNRLCKQFRIRINRASIIYFSCTAQHSTAYDMLGQVDVRHFASSGRFPTKTHIFPHNHMRSVCGNGTVRHVLSILECQKFSLIRSSQRRKKKIWKNSFRAKTKNINDKKLGAEVRLCK